jgi:hypothetical protein
LITRRTAASLLAGIPFAGKAAARDLLKQQGGAISGGSLAGYATASGGMQEANYPQQATGPVGPLMQEWQAARVALGDAKTKRLLLDAAFTKHRQIAAVDPDIEVYRSFSPMAKITYQRQRNVDRELIAISTEPQWSILQPIQAFMQKLMWDR